MSSVVQELRHRTTLATINDKFAQVKNGDFVTFRMDELRELAKSWGITHPHPEASQ